MRINQGTTFGRWLVNKPNNIIMIESKNYQTNISVDELSKMERDMVENKINYGIFISLQSNLVGFKTIDFHAFKDKNGKEYFIFIIGKMIDNISLIDIGIKFINSLNQKTIANFDVMECFNNIKDDISELNNLIKLNENYVDKVTDTKKIINKTLCNLEKDIREYSYKSKVIIEKIINTLNKNINDNIISNTSVVFKKYKKHNMYSLLKKIIDNIQINNVIYTVERYGVINLSLVGQNIGHIKISKTRISLTFNKFDGINFVFKDIENDDNFLVMRNISTQYN